MRRRTMRLGMGIAGLLAVALPAPARGGCGCSKPPPPLAAVRPFAGAPDQAITLFDARLVPGQRYWVQFTAADGSTDWSRGRATVKRDLADGQPRTQLRVRVGAVSLGPCALTVWTDTAPLYGLPDDQFTVTAPPIALRDVAQTVVVPAYRGATGRDGTLYIALDVSAVTDATTFIARGVGLPLAFQAANVAIYNTQGFLMQLLDPRTPGLFQITPGDTVRSSTLAYWRHEFHTYKEAHRQLDAWSTADDPDWHADGTYHVDHDHLLVAIRGVLPNGSALLPGATPPFTLVVSSAPSAHL